MKCRASASVVSSLLACPCASAVVLRQSERGRNDVRTVSGNDDLLMNDCATVSRPLPFTFHLFFPATTLMVPSTAAAPPTVHNPLKKIRVMEFGYNSGYHNSRSQSGSCGSSGRTCRVQVQRPNRWIEVGTGQASRS